MLQQLDLQQRISETWFPNGILDGMIHDWDRLFAGFRRVDPFEAAAEERNKYYDPFVERPD